MNKKAIVFAVAAVLTSGAAFAQSYDYRSDRNDGNRGSRYEQQDRHHDGRWNRVDRDHDGRWERSERRANQSRSYDQRYRHDRYDRNEHRSARDYGRNNYGHSYYQMRRGERLSHQYQDRRYVVSDWRAHRLHQPQYGHHWVQAGNDYALVAIATGIIAQVLLNH